MIGVVTSPTGAVIRDILHRLADRCPTHVLVWPVLVQGEGAAAQIANAVRGFDAMPANGPVPRPDLVIVARGGGSIEDLWSFNEEIVVRAVADCSIPIISAVGHETDTTLSDFAADVRAPTPTAAAEIAVPVRADLIALLTEQGLRAQRAVRRNAAQARERLDTQVRLLPAPDVLLAMQRQRADDLGERLGRGLRHRVTDARAELAGKAGALRPALLRQRIVREGHRLDGLRLRPELLTRRLTDATTALDRMWRLAASLNPDLPLQRGFARVMAQGRLVRTRVDAAQAGQVTLTFADGTIDAIVGGVEPARTTDILPPAPATRPARAKPRETGVTQQDLFSS